MKQTRMITHKLMAMAIALVMGSCSSDVLSDMGQESQGKHTTKMEFVGKVIGFDQQVSTKAKMQSRAASSSTSWKDGDNDDHIVIHYPFDIEFPGCFRLRYL